MRIFKTIKVNHESAQKVDCHDLGRILLCLYQTCSGKFSAFAGF